MPIREFDHLQRIFEAALNRIDPYRMLTDHIWLEGDTLVVAFEGMRHETNLSPYQRILVLGCGKASSRMALAMEAILGNRLSGGLVCTKYDHTESLAVIEQVEAAHPVPDEAGVRAANRMAQLAREADDRTLVIALISGGGSALLPAPLTYSDNGHEVVLTLAHKQAVTRTLLACGADIREINCLRKHLSALKGGRFLQLIEPATCLSFILSDVVGDRLDTIASGITAADDSTYAQALSIIDKYEVGEALPVEALRAIRLGAEGAIPETLKPGDSALTKVTNLLIGTNHVAVMAACDAARSLGYNVVPLTSLLTGEAKEVAKFLAGIALDVRRTGMLVKPPACILLGGETVVTVTGEGKGGRNQEMALAFLAELTHDPESGRHIEFLSASTDGSDGPTDAAGAFASGLLLKRAKAAGLSMQDALKANDSYHFFEALGGLYKTGPTRTNVCDLHILLVT